MRNATFLMLLLALCAWAVPGFAADSPFPQPSLVVYPLSSTGGTPAQAGGNIALLLATKLSQLGGITVKAATPGTERAQYLTAARAADVDYYITGYITPVGDEVSLIIQVVSTTSGNIVFSKSATVRTYADVVAQGDDIHEAILDYANRGLPQVSNLANAATPEPVASSGSVNLTRVLGRHERAAATPPPPAYVGLVTTVDGDAPQNDAAAQSALASALSSAGLEGARLPVSSSEARTNAASLCAANPHSVALFLGSLAKDATSVTLTVNAEKCDGSAVGQQRSQQPISSKGGVSAAIAKAAAADALAFASDVKPLLTAKPLAH